MDDLRRFSGRGNVIEPAARTGGVFAQSQDPRRERIAPAKIVEEPAVQFSRLERLLDFGDAFGRSRFSAHGCGKDEEKKKSRQSEKVNWFHFRKEITAVVSFRATPDLSRVGQRRRLFFALSF